MKLFTATIAALSTALIMGTSASAMITTDQGYSPRELAQGEVSSPTYGAISTRDPEGLFHERVSDRPAPGGSDFNVTRFSFSATRAPVANVGFGPDAR